MSKLNDLSNPTFNRRRWLSTLGAASATALLSGCNQSSSSNSDSNGSVSTTVTPPTTGTGTSSTGGTCVLIPRETEGPFPLMAVLSNSAMVRKDITEGKEGVPLTLKLNIVDINNACSAIDYATVYIWHCDKDGVYSGYSNQTGGVNAVGETFCRGIQDTNEFGEVEFNTIYPGWYNGRITHIHFQVFLFNSAISTATSQLAFPQEITQAVYNSSLYASRGQNTSVTSFSRDGIFSDGVSYQLATVDGDVTSGLTASIQVGISV